jgi:hypothetical protein
MVKIAKGVQYHSSRAFGFVVQSQAVEPIHSKGFHETKIRHVVDVIECVHVTPSDGHRDFEKEFFFLRNDESHKANPSSAVMIAPFTK